MRLSLFLVCFAAPLAAWEFSPVPVCTLSKDDGTRISVTFDGSLYEIRLVRQSGWPPSPVFTIRFVGAAGQTISTTRHRIDGNVLSVVDRGFGNVLDGLQFNAKAVVLIGDVVEEIDLAGAAEPVEAFRACPAAAAV